PIGVGVSGIFYRKYHKGSGRAKIVFMEVDPVVQGQQFHLMVDWEGILYHIVFPSVHISWIDTCMAGNL
ncbi:MAG: hypothetical protein ACK5OU_14680, partial [Dolichospermum sp.]